MRKLKALFYHFVYDRDTNKLSKRMGYNYRTPSLWFRIKQVWSAK